MSKTTTPLSAAATLKKLEAKDPGLKRLLDKAYAYAVFPSVGKANLVIGGGYGRGEVFEKGRRIGFATITQLTIGVQVGGDTFAEVIVFESKKALERFKKGKSAFAANASAVLVKAGAASAKDFEKGAAVYVYPQGGMMLELGIGGQRFKFKPAETQQDQGGAKGQGQNQRGQQQGKGKGAKGAAQSRGEEGEEQEQGEEGEGGDEAEASGGGNRALELAGRAVGGVRSAASKATAMARRHPVAVTVAGVGVAAGLGLLLARALRGAGSEQGEDEGQGSENDEEQDEGAQDSADDQSDESEEEDSEDQAEDSAEDQSDEGEEDQDEEAGDEESDDGGNRSILSRLMSRGRSRA